MNKFIIAGNWKMNTTINEATMLVDSIKLHLKTINLKDNDSVRIVICPPFVNIQKIAEIVKSNENCPIHVGSQNCYFEKKGAFTGEISIEMLKSIDCSYVIIGHSERRTIFAEMDVMINKKLLAILESGLTPILCIGETLEERKSGNTFNILKNQLDTCLANVDKDAISKIVIAYEPVWAIGTGISATTDEIIEAHNWLRNYLIQNYSTLGENVFLLYGGSLNDTNALEILSIKNVNGGLIGGASLDASKFVSIIKTASSIYN